jgi:thioredoxin-related protein
MLLLAQYTVHRKENIMKTGWLAGLFVLGILLTGCDQDVAQAAAIEAPGIWQVDFDRALEQAAAENKYVFVNFSGLQWCGWCKALEGEVLSQRAFIDYAKERLICVLLDYRGSGRAVNNEFAQQHEALLNQYKVYSFPTVLILNPGGNVIERTGYQSGGAEAYVNYLKDLIAADRGQ